MKLRNFAADQYAAACVHTAGGHDIMRKKQLYAILLAGVMATGSAPTAVFAAEEGVQAASEATTDFAASSSETDA